MEVAAKNITEYSDKYVNDGLVLQYDGVFNVSKKSHSDAGLIWKDLIGDCDYPLPNNIDVQSNCMEFKFSDLFALKQVNIEKLLSSGKFSFEICFKQLDAFTEIFNIFTTYGIIRNCVKYSEYQQPRDMMILRYSGFDQPNHFNAFSVEPSQLNSLHTLSFTYDATSSFTSYYDGKLFRSWSISQYPLKTDEMKLSLGNYGDVKIYSVRAYSRLLQADEIKANCEIDKKRFTL